MSTRSVRVRTQRWLGIIHLPGFPGSRRQALLTHRSTRSPDTPDACFGLSQRAANSGPATARERIPAVRVTEGVDAARWRRSRAETDFRLICTRLAEWTFPRSRRECGRPMGQSGRCPSAARGSGPCRGPRLHGAQDQLSGVGLQSFSWKTILPSEHFILGASSGGGGGFGGALGSQQNSPLHFRAGGGGGAT